MALVCPNKSTPEWKLLVAHVGEFEAYRSYMANEYTIPHVVSTNKLKKKIGLGKGPYNSKQMAAVNHRLRIYNRYNDSSHRIEYKRITTGARRLFSATLIYNYLPADKETQADKNKREQTEGEIETGRWEDGRYLTPSQSLSATTKGEVRPRFQDLVETKEQEVTALYSERTRMNSAILEEEKKKKPDQQRLKNLRIKRENIRITIDKTKKEALRISNIKRLGQIASTAESDLRTLEDIFLKKLKPSTANLRTARRIIDIWSKGGDFSGNGPHVFYDEDEFKNRTQGHKEITAKFVEWKDRAENFIPKLMELEQDIIDGKVQDTYASVGIDDLQKPLPDGNFVTRNMLDISEVGNAYFSAAHEWVKDAMFAGKEELNGRHERIDELVKETGLTEYEMFRQTFSNTDSRKTGEMVFWWTQEYMDLIRDKKKALRRQEIRALHEKNPARKTSITKNANRLYVAHLRENTIALDARILFHDPEFTDYPAPSEAEREAYIAELKELLGEEVYEKYYALAENKVNEFKAVREARFEMMEAETDQKAAQRDDDVWMARNSPYLHGQVMEEGFNNVLYKDKYRVYPTEEYTINVPKRNNIKGKPDGVYYDNNYDTIRRNPNLLSLHNELFTLFEESRGLLPIEKTNYMNMNSIPFLKKRTMEAMVGDDGNLSKAFGSFKEEMLDSVRMDDLSTVSATKDEQSFQLQMLKNNKDRIQAYIYTKDNEERKKTGEKLSGKERADKHEDWRREIMDQIATEEKSFDLPRLAKAWSSFAFSYKHKSSIENQMRIMADIIRRMKVTEKNAAGENRTDKYDKLRYEEGLPKTVSMLEDFFTDVFWGYPSNRPEGKGKKKVFTKKEKERVEEIDKTIEDLDQLLKKKEIKSVEHTERSKVLTNEREKIGGVRVASKFGDWILKYVQLLGLGYNVFAGVSNLGFGLMSNWIEAADNRNYSQRNFRKAFFLSLNSVVRNITFNKFDGLDGNAGKIRALMDRFDVLKESRNELYRSTFKSPFGRIGRALRFLNPYNIQSRTEYLNQAPVMIAIMLEEMVTTEDGKQISMWDAFNLDGTTKEGVEISLKQLSKVKVIIDKVVKMNHGNYDPGSKLSVKKTFLGRAVSQFRTWAFQGFSERINTDIKDNQLPDRMHNEDFVDRKGRYRSFGRYYHRNNQFFGAGMLLNLTYNLVRKLVGFNTTFEDMVDNKFTTTDAANMRKNLTEIMFLIGLWAFARMLKGGVDDEDDRGDMAKFQMYFFINQAARLQTDILFYLSPSQFERLTKNAIPLFSIVKDTQELIDAAWVLGFQGTEEDILKSGTNRGESEAWNQFKDFLPGIKQLDKLEKASSMVYKK